MAEIAYRWRSRGIGLDETGGCLFCDAPRSPGANRYFNNICAFVSPEDEVAILALFSRGAKMHYYHADRKVPQIVVGSCDRHLPILQRLSDQLYIAAGTVAYAIEEARLMDLRLQREAEREITNVEPPGASEFGVTVCPTCRVACLEEASRTGTPPVVMERTYCPSCGWSPVADG